MASTSWCGSPVAGSRSPPDPGIWGPGPEPGIHSRSSQGESLATGDFNGDHLSDIFIVAQKGPDANDDPDYLVTQTLPLNFERRSMGVINGAGDDVDAVDYNRDGSADFIVSNGDKRRAGPVQLWTNQVTTP